MAAKPNQSVEIPKRDFLKQDEGKLTYIQVFGFILITLAMLYFASFLLSSGVFAIIHTTLDNDQTANGISLAFFTAMLGVSFAFPEMLRGQTKDISTMRIIVFMFANVICMLLLKTGWKTDSLSDIGLDGFWMGVIAFLFGAKATQTYFENVKSLAGITSSPNETLSKTEISRLAVIQNKDELIARHPNIESVTGTLKERNSCVTIYTKDNRVDTIPKEVNATLKNGAIVKVPTEIVSDIGVAKPHIGQSTDELSDSNSPNYYGSICCLVESTTNPNFIGVVTAGHIFTYGDYYNYGGVLGSKQRREALINNNPGGSLFFQQMKFNQDIAIIELTDKSTFLDNYVSFNKGFYKVSEIDFNSDVPNVTIISRQNKRRDAFIVDFHVPLEINYYNKSQYIRNIILIGSSNDRTISETVSVGGDSGSAVYHKDSGKLIGLLLGGNNRFSFVLPIQETLDAFNFKIL